ncbi:MAG: translation initiation factor IF-3 [Dethiobacteria bacterium]|nr:translation initiation factor IF-3 [Bacillota bacterium]
MSKSFPVNEGIKAKEIRVVDVDGKQLGIMNINDALKIAQSKNLDLVNVAPSVKPPVCRIMDYGKFRYEQSKREKEARKKQKILTIKEIKLRPNIEEHDFRVKVKNGQRFLKNGDKVKVTIMFRGREITHSELGKKLSERLAEELSECGVVEKKPKVEGRNMVMVIAPK